MMNLKPSVYLLPQADSAITPRADILGSLNPLLAKLGGRID